VARRIDLQHAEPVVDRTIAIILIDDLRETVFTLQPQFKDAQDLFTTALGSACRRQVGDNSALQLRRRPPVKSAALAVSSLEHQQISGGSLPVDS
jgi:hypothetical protein